MIIELLSYTTQPNVSEAAHIRAAVNAHQVGIKPLPGFRDRVLCGSGEPGFWTDMIFWSDQHSYDAAAKTAKKDPVCLVWAQTIEKESISLQTTELLAGYRKDDFRIGETGCWHLLTWFLHPGVDAEDHITLSRDAQKQVIAGESGFLSAAMGRQPLTGEFYQFTAWKDLAAAKAGRDAVKDACDQHPRFQFLSQQRDPRRTKDAFHVVKQRL